MVKPWNEISSYYKRLVEASLQLESMLKLVNQIETSNYSIGLYAWTSMHDLCVVQKPVDYPYDGPYLKISPLFDGNIEFRYIDTFFTEKQWHRIVNEEDAFSRLESFIDQLHWRVRENRKHDS